MLPEVILPIIREDLSRDGRRIIGRVLKPLVGRKFQEWGVSEYSIHSNWFDHSMQRNVELP